MSEWHGEMLQACNSGVTFFPAMFPVSLLLFFGNGWTYKSAYM